MGLVIDSEYERISQFLVIDSEYERISKEYQYDTLSVNSAQRLSKWLCCSQNQCQNSVFQPSENFCFENFSGPNHDEPYNRHFILENVSHV